MIKLSSDGTCWPEVGDVILYVMHWNLNLGTIIRFKTGLGLLDAIGGGNVVDAHMRFDPRILLLLFLMVLVWYIV